MRMRLEHWLYALPLRLRAVFRRREVEAELDEELRYHLERQIEAHVAQGMTPEAARTAALRAMGGVERRKDECRDSRGVSALDSLARDARYALRSLAQNRGFATVAILTLTLGIGATTAIFTVVDGVVLRPLRYSEPHRLVSLRYEQAETIAPGTFFDWMARARSFQGSGLAEYWTPNLTGQDKPEELRGIRLSADMLPLLGVRPLLGRHFLSDEAHEGTSARVVLRYEAWQNRFGGDSAIIGRTITLDGVPHTIVGVMPPGFRFVPFWASEAEVAAPLVLDRRRTDRAGSSLRAFARLRPGVTLDDARADLAAAAAQVERDFPGTSRNVTAVPLQTIVVGNVRPALFILLAAVGLVLLIACANVAHLQLIRAAGRERELAVRAALGASTGRLVQQSLVESAILAAVGGALGLVLAKAGVHLLIALGPPELPRLDGIALDARVFVFLLAVTVGTCVLFGLAPARTASRVDVQTHLKEGSRGAADSLRRRRLRGVLVVSEFALAFVLLVGAGLVLRSFVGLLRIEPGYDARRVLSMQISLRGTADEAPARRPLFFRELLRRVSALPGVDTASATNHLPLHGDNWHFPFYVEGRSMPRAGDEPRALFRIARPGYFQTMRIGLVSGRDFTAADEANASSIVIVNERMARLHWPGENPLGRRLTVDSPARNPHWFTVVGVVRDVRQERWSSAASEEMYFPSVAASDNDPAKLTLRGFLNPVSMTLVVRATADPAGLIRAIEGIVRSMNQDAPVSDVITMEQAIAEQLAAPRFYLLLLGAFGSVAIVLAAVGVYGVISYAAARRAHEMGVRLALGARPSDPFRLIVKQGMVLAAIGGAIGVIASLAGARFLGTLLYGVQPTDSGTFAAVGALLGSVALGASCIPAWRASRIDPAVALRSE